MNRSRGWFQANVLPANSRGGQPIIRAHPLPPPRSPDVRERWYTPQRIRFLLAHLDMLESGRFPSRPESERVNRFVRSQGWPAENAVVVHADLTAALDCLPWFTRECVRRHIVKGHPVSDIAASMRCDWETVARHEQRGVQVMAEYLGYTGRQPTDDPRSPTIWRRDDD